MIDSTKKLSSKHDDMLEILNENIRVSSRMRHEYDLLEIWVKAYGDEKLIKEYRELVEKFRVNWDG